ncbi:unnamed protein product [Amoebophrya sp. A25]|nr:unnamed protein product [Amoebophrya sp. A25]|eukprot:GSA25T00025807001.1
MQPICSHQRLTAAVSGNHQRRQPVAKNQKSSILNYFREPNLFSLLVVNVGTGSGRRDLFSRLCPIRRVALY